MLKGLIYTVYSLAKVLQSHDWFWITLFWLLSLESMEETSLYSFSDPSYISNYTFGKGSGDQKFQILLYGENLQLTCSAYVIQGSLGI